MFGVKPIEKLYGSTRNCIEKNQDLIKDNAFDELFSRILDEESGTTVDQIIQFFLGNCDIDIFRYMTAVPKHLFFRNTDVENVIIPKNITEIGYSAFKSCDNLKSIHLEGKLHKLNNLVFAHCSQLQSIIFDEDCEFIESDTFSEIPETTLIECPDNSHLSKWLLANDGEYNVKTF